MVIGSSKENSGTVNRRPTQYYLAAATLPVLALLLLAFTPITASKAAGSTREPEPAKKAESAQSAGADDRNSAAILEAYRHVEVASVSDAIEQLLGRRMYLPHKMQPLFTARITGYALTVRLEKQENHDSHSLDGMLEAIDRGKPQSVYVMSIEDGADLGGMGGLMGTAMAARNFSGAIIDGAVRDTAYLKKIAFPVYAKGIAPSTLVGHYRCSGTEVPVVIDNVPIHPGDIISADGDGVVIVPRDHAEEVLALAQQLDFKEHSMYPLIEKTKSIEAAVKQFGRL
jgi:regulator of RNase E activity RraA